MSSSGSQAPCFTFGALSSSASLPGASVAPGVCEPQPCCPVLGGGGTARPSQGLASDSHRGGLEPWSCPLPGRRPAPLKPLTLAKLLLSSQCSGLSWSLSLALSICPSAGGRRDMLPCPSHASRPAPSSSLLQPGPQSRFFLSLRPDSGLRLGLASLWGCTWLPSLPTLVSQERWGA